MPALIVFRAVQGIGAGAVQPMSMTIVGDLYSVEERARVQGYVASVWGVVLGGRPDARRPVRRVRVVALDLLRQPAARRHRRLDARPAVQGAGRRGARTSIDYLGAALLTGGCSLLILGLLEGGVGVGAGAPSPSAAHLRGGRRAGSSRSCSWSAGRPSRCCRCGCSATGCSSAATSSALVVGALLIGLTSYVPTFAQGVLGTGALVAGFALAAMTIGWPHRRDPVGPALPAHRLPRHRAHRQRPRRGRRGRCASCSPQRSPVWAVAAACFVVGRRARARRRARRSSPSSRSSAGTAAASSPATNMFCRSMGSAVGAAVFGAIANATLAGRFAHPPAAVAGSLPDSVDATSLVLGGQDAGGNPAAASFIRTALYDATHNIFLALLLVAVLGVGAMLLMPRRTEQLTFD